MSSNTSTIANRQWASRPEDQRFWSLAEVFHAAEGYKAEASELTLPANQMRVLGRADDQMMLTGPGIPENSLFTHYSFDSFCSRIGQPPSGLTAGPPADLVAPLINWHLAKADAKPAQILLRSNGSHEIRHVASSKYGRIWNADVVQYFQNNLPDDWKTPPCRYYGNDPVAAAARGKARKATLADEPLIKAGIPVKAGDWLSPPIYASDRDIFLFFIDENREIKDGSENGLRRGLIVTNSENGNGSFRCLFFLHNGVCSNHIIWSYKEIKDVKIKHMRSGKELDDPQAESARLQAAWMRAQIEMARALPLYHGLSAKTEENAIQTMQSKEIASKREDVIDVLVKEVKTANSNAGKKRLDAAYQIAEDKYPLYGSPRSYWGMAQGLTELAQSQPYGDKRHDIDIAASDILALALGQKELVTA